MNRLKDYFKKNKVSIMVIPKSQKSIKQWHFNLAFAFTLLVVLIIANIILLTSTLTSKLQSSHLVNKNQELNENLTIQSDRIESLESINDLRMEEIKVLKSSLEETLVYVDSRFREMESVQQNVSELVSMFNQETSSNISLPISRSFDRFLNTSSESLIPNDDALLGQVDFLVNNDDISELILSQGNEYTKLINQIQDQMIYLDCRPDFYPSQGILTSKFGYRKDPVTKRSAKHNGIDIANSTGTDVSAAGEGIVIFAGYNGSFGRVIIIDHGYGYKTVYGHLKEILVSCGDRVTKGQHIGEMGSSGKSTGTHLHFEVRYNDVQINPLNILKNN